MDEKIFKRLVWAGMGEGDQEDLDELVRLGYITVVEGRVQPTESCLAEASSFVEQKKEALYRAIKELKGAEDLQGIMGRAGIEEVFTLCHVAQELVRDNKLVKDGEKNYIIK